MLTFIDWFAGIGGFRRGMELAGHKCVGFCEYDKYAVASYTSMHLITERERERLASLDLKKRQKEILKEEYRHGEWYESDVVRVHAGDIPRADCWCFGFPCQDISVAGHQKGFKGNRSSLFFRITGLLKELKEEDRPKYLFIENVRNLLSINRGYDFARLLVELDSIGYDAEWEVLNSKDFGVPQNRERCFIIGHLRGAGGREVFPLRRDAEEASIQGAEVKQIAQMNRPGRDNLNQYRVYDKEGIAPCLNTMEGGGREPHIMDKAKFVDLCYDAQITDVARCIKARQDEGIQYHKGSSSGVLVPVNPEDDGTSRTIKYQYQKNSAPNFMDRGDRGATAVAVKTVGNTNPCGHGIGGNVYGTENSLAPTIACNKNEGYKVAIPCLTPNREEKRQNGRRFKENGDPMFTLTAQDRHGVMIEADPSESDLKILNRGEECESKRVYDPSGIVATIAARDYKDAKKVAIPQACNSVIACEERTDEGLRTFKDNCCGAIRSQADGGKKRVLISEATSKGYQEAEEEEEDSINFSVLGSKTRRGRVGKGVAQTLDTGCQQGVLTSYRIRKLTPKECFRLQGWTDDYFEKAEFINSNAQLYKQAGNGVTVNVIYQIARRLE